MTTGPTDAGVPAVVDAALADPAGFLAREAAAADAAVGQDTLAVRWARGLALRELGRLIEARDELDLAAYQADAAGEQVTAGAIRSSLAVVLLHLGATEQALGVATAAAEVLEGAAAARNQMQIGLLLQRVGRQREAAAAYDAALPALVRAGDEPAVARLLSNRGVLHAYLGELALARRDLERSIESGRRLGATRAVALGLQNLGFVAGRAGDLPAALRSLAEADGLLADLDDGAAARAVLDLDRAAVLAEAGLLEEAIERAEAAMATHAAAGDRTNLAEAELQVARLRLLAGHLDAAEQVAERAASRFVADGRTAWWLQARYVVTAARARAGTAVDGAATAVLADELEAGGWPTEARVVRLWTAEQALRDGDLATARALLAALGGAPRRAPALARAQHHLATALLRTAEQDRAGARRSIRAGLDVLTRSRLVFGSAELRAYAARHATELVELGTRSALEDGRPAEALVLLDRARAADVHAPPTPPDDPELARDLAELRRLQVEEEETARHGGDVRALVTARVGVERRIRDRARQATGALDPARTTGSAGVDVPSLRRALAGRTLAAYLQLDGHLHLLTVTPRATRHDVLAPLAAVSDAAAYLRSALRRLASGRGSTAAIAAADDSVARSVETLALLLGLDRFEQDGAVIVPAGVLHGLPWSALAAVTGHVPTVTPSASAWLTPATAPAPASAAAAGAVGPPLLVAGPRLPGANDEVERLASARGDATVLLGSAATAAAVRRGLETAGTAHIAAHGTFRADNPLFSSLELADGPLTVYELEALRRVPDRLVLSSCDAATTSVVAGDAVLGLSAVLLRLGAGSLIAPSLEIPDAATTPLMVALHGQLDGGADPAAALGAAIEDSGDAHPAERAVRASFVVLGRAAG